MGLEHVEFIMLLEDELNITISDDIYSSFNTVEDVVNYIALTHFDNSSCEKERVLEIVKRIIHKQYFIPKHKINFSSNFAKDFGFG